MKKTLLFTILVLASVLRLYDLTHFPSGFNADEAALGYNAYSLLTTGRDEHGHPWPINLESFGDFKPALYTYILIPFIKILGLTEFAVRLPSAIFGILAVLFIYLLVKELIDDNCALISAALLSVSPWHLHFSRGAWETNVATTLLLVGSWAFVKWTKTPKLFWLLFSILGFVFSMYTYQSTRVIAPLLGLGLALIYFKDLIKSQRQMFLGLTVLIVLLLPITYNLITTDASSRFTGVGLLADEGPVNRVRQLRGQHPNPSSIFSRLLHNRLVIYGIQFVANYTDHFDPNFLFITGDTIERSRVPDTGLLHYTDALFVVLGLIFLLKSPKTNHWRTIICWLFVAPTAAALTFQTPHALRAQNMVIPLTIITAMGVYWFLRSWKLFGICVLCLVYSWQFTRYLHQYYVHYPREYPSAWEYGFKELVSYTESVKDQYEKILVTDKYDQPYILFLFYSKYPPFDFQSDHTLTFRDQFNFSTVRDYDKYHFESTPWDKVRDTHSALIIAAPDDIPQVGVNVVKTIYFPNGQPAFKIVSN